MGAVKYALYTTLGVPKESTLEEITRAYRRLALRYHPDRNPDGVEEFKAIANAYALLSDPDRRAVYDVSGVASDFAAASHDVPDEVARQQRSAELADQVRDFFASYAGSAEERDDVVRGYEKCDGDFKKMVRQYLLFDNGVTTEVQRLHRLVLRLIEKGKLSPTAAWAATSTPVSLLKLERFMRREREEAEEVAKEMSREAAAASAAAGDLSALQVAIRQRQQSSYTAMLDHLERTYVTKKNGDGGAGASKRRTRAVDAEEAPRKRQRRATFPS
ncbi:chaperone protein DNAj [Novymonas esmeraldas]|uniref:Chaperone protein DNAj n=1 Tax=Novymonas esmeraldas TaxID=1808958 RepID=A0AAW0F1Q4_9TRYP